MPGRVRISVIIPTLNRLNDIKDCISALEKQTMDQKDFEIIVVDGGSTDGTLQFLDEKTKSSPIELRYYVEKKKGAGAARNLGVNNSSAEFIAFTDDDCIPDKNWLAELSRSFPADERCAGVGGPIVADDQKNMISRFCDYCRNVRRVDFEGKVFHLPTMNVLYRRSALLEVGIFDEKVIITEDIHLSLKLIKKGYYLRNIDTGVVRHKDPRDLATLYHKAWLQGTGIATVAGMEGVPLREDALTLMKELVIPKKYVERFVKTRKLTVSENLAFGLLHRFWRLALHNGYRYEMKKSHL